MSASNKMILRVQSSEGTTRVEALPSDATAVLYERVHDALQLASFAFALYRDRGRHDELVSSKSRTLADIGLRHGDMLYLSPVNGAVLFDQPATSAESNNKPSNKAFGEPMQSTGSAEGGVGGGPQEDEVDLMLYQEPGTIQRQRDDKLCRHNSNGCCVHCSPLEPWDENYLKEHNIKHMSFHSYLRKITSGKFISLEEMSCKIKPGCKEHPPWPRGICSACQPGAVTLTRQVYRHVDNVLVERPDLVDRFLSAWRATGHQRVGFLYGRYEPHPDVPLGVRARVHAIYEPPQRGSRDAVTLLQPDTNEELLDDIASRLGLRRVGWMFTDLVPEDMSAGTVRHLRGVDTHFLSAQECITAAHYQNRHRNACRHAKQGTFGSKFVTVCASGDAAHRVSLEGYQVSGQCAALVRDGILLPTLDAPELGYIRESSDAQYVPDVYYKERDAYGNEVGVLARRVPVAYLLVDVPVGTTGAAHTANTNSITEPFPPPNRPPPLPQQSLRALHHHIQTAPSFLDAMSELHVLLYLACNPAMPLSLSALEPLLTAVRARDEDGAAAWRESAPAHALIQLVAAAADLDSADVMPTNDMLHDDDDDPTTAGHRPAWTCALCTYHNAATRDACEMCAMPRSDAM